MKLVLANNKCQAQYDSGPDRTEPWHLLSVFGNDSDVGAITAAVYEKARFGLTFPGGETQEISLGEGEVCYRGSVSIPGREQAIRHMIGLSGELRGLKSLSRTFVLRPEPIEVWTALVHRFGLPGLPEWANGMTHLLKAKERMTPVDSIGCSAVVISATCEELLEWMGSGVGGGELSFPESNGPARWSNGTLWRLCDLSWSRCRKRRELYRIAFGAAERSRSLWGEGWQANEGRQCGVTA
jgi:hypothetical protein